MADDPEQALEAERERYTALGGCPEEFRVFFERRGEGCFFTAEIVNDCLLASTGKDDLTERVFAALEDTGKIAARAFAYYFPAVSPEEAARALADFRVLTPYVFRCDFGAALKNSLWNFFGDPDAVMSTLRVDLRARAERLRAYYVQHADEVETFLASMPWEEIDGLEPKTDRDGSVCYFTVCPLAHNLAVFCRLPGIRYVAVGCNFLQMYSVRKRRQSEFDLCAFGKVIGDPTRYAILELLVRQEEMSRSDLCLRLELKLSAALYHLTMMTDDVQPRSTKTRSSISTTAGRCTTTCGSSVGERTASTRRPKAAGSRCSTR